MNSEIKNCQNCKKEFRIEPEDFKFYARISVPPPTWCPECRLIRRMLWRNERTLYRRTCDLCHKDIISNFSQNNEFPVYCGECWWSDNWDPFKYGRDVNFSEPFLTQFQKIVETIPHLNLWAFNNVNSDFINYSAYNKNGYLTFSTMDSEDVYYSSNVDKSFYIFDSDKVKNSELCYGNLHTANISRGLFILNSRECINSTFLFDCANCHDCYMSSNLRNKKYYIRNKAYSKESYFEEIAKMQLGSHGVLIELQEEFITLVGKSLHKFGNLIKTINSTGDYLTNAKNAKNSFYSDGVENIKNCLRTYELKDAYDVTGNIKSELTYEGCVAGENNYRSKFYTHSSSMSNSEYFQFCRGSSNLFGCFALHSKSYCILNKQYSKEEYEKFVPKIINHMTEMPYIDKRGLVYGYGEFFSPNVSPFAYNEAISQEYFPLNKTEAVEKGYFWKDSESRNYKISLKIDELPDHINDVDNSILEQIIECPHGGKCDDGCTEAFRIIPQELDFLRKMNLPLPRLCPNCRHYQRMKQRNPLKLWHRKCMCGTPSTSSGQATYQNTIEHEHKDQPCPNEFETTYAPERPEIVYCESCYLKEVV